MKKGVKDYGIDAPILLLAPTGNDASVACDVLQKAGLKCEPCSDLKHVCTRISEDTGCILVAEEALSNEDVPKLSACLQQQPPWSDIPVVVLTSGGEMNRIHLWNAGMFGPRANVTLLERPFHTATLLSVLEGSLRARSRQYQIRDLLEQRQRLFELEKKARTEAEKLNRAKDDFLATLSHELRTPLTTMLGWAKILTTTPVNESTTQRAIQAIEKSARSQAQLIDDLLDVSRIITGKFQIEKQSMDLVQLIHTSVEMVGPAAEAKNIQINVEVDENPGPVMGDFYRLQQVFWNILSNAIKFTSQGGSVDVKLIRTNSHARFIVQDTGKGIPPDLLPHIFERFRQADSTPTRNQGGLGLGLAIVQHIVELHQGTVTARSEGIGTGATFEVTLPLASMETRTYRTGKKNLQPSESVDLNGLRVLLVEDDEETREMIVIILNEGRARVRAVSNVAQAFEILNEWKPQIVISDIGMPTEDGYSLISRLRANPATRDIPAIALTAYASSADKGKALQAGFQVHMPKPLDPGDLLEVILGLLNAKV